MFIVQKSSRKSVRYQAILNEEIQSQQVFAKTFGVHLFLLPKNVPQQIQFPVIRFFFSLLRIQ